MPQTDADSNVRMTNLTSWLSPEGVASKFAPGKPVDAKVTQEVVQHNLRQAKFLKNLGEIPFEDLQEVKQKNGDTIWAATQTIDNENFNFYISQAEVLGSIQLTEIKSDKEIEDLAKKHEITQQQTHIVVDGKRYSVNMNIPLRFGSGMKQTLLVDLGMTILGEGVLGAAIAGIVAKLGAQAFKTVFKEMGFAVWEVVKGLVRGLFSGAYNFVRVLIHSIVLGAGTKRAFALAATAAGESWSRAVQGITRRTVAYSIGAVLIATGIYLVIDKVLHESYQRVYLYNLTKYDLKFDMAHVSDGKLHDVPATVLRGDGEMPLPMGLSMGHAYSGCSFLFESDSRFHGFGYAMRLQLTDPDSEATKKTLACMFDVPYSGTNSLYCTATAPADYKAFYKDHEGKLKATQHSAGDAEIEIIATYDHVDGKHRDPESGEDLFFYNSLIIVREKSPAT